MQEPVDEHVVSRKAVKDLVDANIKYADGKDAAIDVIIEKPAFLISFYPEHIIKEDKIFFPDTEKYFTEKELDKMPDDFREFDRKMIHEKYNKRDESLSVKYI